MSDAAGTATLDSDAERLARAAVDSMPGLSVLVFDREFRFRAVFGGAVEAHGYDRAAILGRSAADVLPPQAWERLRPFYERVLRGETLTDRAPSSDGLRVYETTFSPVAGNPAADGAGPVGGIIVARDVTAEQQALEALSESEHLYRMISETSGDVVSRVDTEGRYTFVSQAAKRLYGWEPEEMLGKASVDFIHPEEHEAALRAQAKMLEGSEEELTAQYRYRCADGSWLSVEKRISVIRDGAGEIAGLQAATRDITERKRLEAKLRHEARHDQLTGLWNRAGLHEQVQSRVAEGRRYETPTVLVLLDLDGLKAINDRDGHEAGDGQLVAVARAIEGAVRESDFCARFGGDEFALLLPHTDLGAATLVAERVAAAVRQVGAEQGTEHGPTTVSIGLAALGRADDADEWFRRADLAMYEAKRAGGDRVRAAKAPG